MATWIELNYEGLEDGEALGWVVSESQNHGPECQVRVGLTAMLILMVWPSLKPRSSLGPSSGFWACFANSLCCFTHLGRIRKSGEAGMAAAPHPHSMPGSRRPLLRPISQPVSSSDPSSATLKHLHGLDLWFSTWGSNDPFPGAAFRYLHYYS